MLITLVVLAVVGAIIWWVNKDGNKSLVSIAIKKVADVNKDGTIDGKDAVVVLTKVADVNKDGKADIQDAVVVGKKITKKVQAVITKKKKKS